MLTDIETQVLCQDMSPDEMIPDWSLEHVKSQTRALSLLAFLYYLKQHNMVLREAVSPLQTVTFSSDSMVRGIM